MIGLVDRVRRRVRLLGGLVALTGAIAVTSGLLARRAQEDASRRARDATAARALGALGRAQYIDELHRARGLAERHPPAEPWTARIERAAARLSPALDVAERARLARVEQRSRALSIVLAPREGGEPSPDDEHAAQAIVDALVDDADRIADRLERRAEDAEASALGASRLAVVLGGAFSALGVLFAWVIGRRLVAEVTAPVSRLRAVTERVREGERSARVGPLETAELHEVGAGLDAMLDALDEADERVRAAEALAVLGRVAATVAHEMNNPLAVLRGTVAALSEGAPEGLARELAIVDDEARACQRIVDDLRVASHAPLLRLGPVDPSALAAEVAARRAMGARLSLDVAPDHLLADEVRLRQVLDNLLDNAEHATGGGGSVIITGRRTGDRYELSVDDDGPGVSDADAARVFEPFVSGREGGSGLGLAVCKAIADAHGGALSLGRSDAGGARFVLTLPASASQA
ncbi:MAG: HAMP domain-containing histidine kinase [Polyangiaceae bacterium]|nr:HAMP domain-containing histidine kinase [Polyangiaceae bacterium]